MDPRVCIITGAGTGIGAATALDLAGTGCPVHLVGRRADRLAEVADRIRETGGTVEVHPCSVQDVGGLKRVAERAIARHGRIDVLVANAAIHDTASLRDGDPDKWRELIDTNVLGVLYACHAVLPQMYRQRGGHVVIVSSVSGRITYAGEPVYTASKHATVALGDCLRQAIAAEGIRVTPVKGADAPLTPSREEHWAG